MADRDITLSLDLETKDAVNTSKELQSQIEDIFKTQDGAQSPAMTALSKQMKDTLLQAQEMQAELEKLGSTQIETEQYKEQQDILKDLQTELQQLQAKEKDYLENWGDTNATFYTDLHQQIEESKQGIAEITQELEAMRQDGTAFVSGKETEQYAEMERKLDNINDKLKVQLVKHDQIVKKQEESNAKLKKTEKLQQMKGLKTGFSNLLKYAIGIRSLYALFNKLRQAIKEGFENLLKDNKALKSQVDNLKGSLTTLKNSLASAFAPIVSAIIPYIQKLVDWLTMLMDKVAQFSAAIAGQKKYSKAIKQTGDDIANAGKKAKGSLGSFDKLNNITTNDDSNKKMFEEIDIDSKVLDKVEQLKDMLKEAATFVGDNFKQGFEMTFDSGEAQKNLQDIQDNLVAIKDAYVEIFNDPEVQKAGDHLVESTSKTFGAVTGVVADAGVLLLRDIVAMLTEPVVRIKDTIKSVMANVLENTAKLFDTLTEKLSSMWAVVRASYEEYIKPTVDNVIEILAGAYQWILEVFDEIYAWLTENIGVLVGTVLDEIGPCVDQIFAAIKSVGDLLLWLWQSILLPILNWVKDKIWPVIKVVLDVVVSAVKNGIKVVSNVIQLVFNFIKTTIGAIVDLLTGKPGEALEKFKNFFKDAFENVRNVVQSVWDFLEDFAMGFFGIFEKIGDAIGSAFGGIKDFFGGIFGGNKKSTASIPGYASGQVIPPSMSAHLAILGDNKQETEVVSPLSTIRQAVTEAMQNMGGTSSGQTIVLNLDGREFMRVLVDRNNDYKKQNGGVSAFA